MAEHAGAASSMLKLVTTMDESSKAIDDISPVKGNISVAGVEGSILLPNDLTPTESTPAKAAVRADSFDKSINQPHDTPQVSRANENQYCCEECGQLYKSRSGLNEHSKMNHKNTPRYRCKVCSQGFMNKTQLCSHERAHIQMKEYQCHKCEKAFNHKKNLVYHIAAVHDGSDPRKKCDLCDSAVASQNFARHRATHFPNKYHCPICRSTFNDKTNLKRHAKKCSA